LGLPAGWRDRGRLLMRVRFEVMAIVAAGVFAASCASAGGGGEVALDPNAPLACINIDNRQGGGSMERIFLVESSRRQGGSVEGGFSTSRRPGEGVRVGDAGVGRVTRWCTQNVALPGRYFLRIERPSADNIDPARNQNQARVQETADMVLSAGDLWTWDVRRDRLTRQPGGATGGDR